LTNNGKPKGTMGDTLKLCNPSKKFWMLTSAILLLFLLVGEVILRIDAVQNRLSAPSIGSRHRQLEIQFARLDRLVENEGPVDCIFLGSSMVWLGINPQVVSEIVEERTGHELRCFNFGVSAMPASSAGEVASVLVKKYHPSLLIYGTFARDFAIPADAEDAYVITETPWIRYRNGEFDLSGLIYELSKVYSYKGLANNFVQLGFDEVFEDNFGPEEFRAYGLDPKFDIRMDVNQSPLDPEDVGNENALSWLYEYNIYPKNPAGLRQIIQQVENGTQVVVIEMPFYQTGYQFFKNGKQDYDQYVNQVVQLTSSNGIQFWRLSEQDEIEMEGWWDILHLNIKGANQFSKWIGNQLSDAFLQSSLESTHRPIE
jgi:hypothetical protein